jgi:hypothetical protein
MARGTQLLVLLQMLRAEIARSASVAVGVEESLGFQSKLADRQQLLYDSYDWPFMNERFNMPLNGNQRYYDVPTNGPGGATLNLERVEEAWVYFGNLPRKLERGILEKDYAYFNSDLGITADPALKWDVHSTGSVTTTNPRLEQIEIWPVPSDNSQYTIFRGVRQLRPLVALSDVADLDDLLIVLLVAAEILAKQDAGNASIMKTLAEKRIADMRGRARGADRRFRLGMGKDIPDHPNKIVVRAS